MHPRNVESWNINTSREDCTTSRQQRLHSRDMANVRVRLCSCGALRVADAPELGTALAEYEHHEGTIFAS